MPIEFNHERNIFSLNTKNTTLQIKIDRFGYLLRLYYGPAIQDPADYIVRSDDRSFSPNPGDAGLDDRTFSLDFLPQEYPSRGTGDFRIACLQVQNADGSTSCDLRYVSHEIRDGKYEIPGLPAVHATADRAETLVIIMEDRRTRLRLELFYGVLSERDVITRSVRIINRGSDTVVLEKAASACLDLIHGRYDFIHFAGSHNGERYFEKNSAMKGVRSVGSKRGVSSHQHNPFIILAEEGATETAGRCYGLAFVWSGDFLAETEFDQYEHTRVVLGIHPDEFRYPLRPNEIFLAPEVIMSFSAAGFTPLSHNFHKTILYNVCRGEHVLKKRPVLINNWEATYFDFTGDKILSIAEQASELGIEMLVLDDGWFGNRNDDFRGLGDWVANEKKLGGPLKDLVKKINELGLKFGIWMEPEMVSEDSDLYRAHPDWALTIPGKEPIRSRSQLALDFSRKEVVDNIFDQMCAIFDSADIDYLKWDMNRSLCDVWSAAARSTEQGTVRYRYVLGIYDLLERLITRYPRLLIEGCCGGGGRFDAGMMYYTPQIWCSDNTDAIDRIFIQHGTSFAYPVSAVGSHVSSVPNHQTGRSVNFDTRATVAMAGTFGYELDLSDLTAEEKEKIKQQVKDYNKYWRLIRTGDYYRLSNPAAGDRLAAWLFVSEDGSEGLLSVVTLSTRGNPPYDFVRLIGLDPKRMYRFENRILSGSALMNVGVPVPQAPDEYQSWQVHFHAV